MLKRVCKHCISVAHTNQKCFRIVGRGPRRHHSTNVMMISRSTALGRPFFFFKRSTALGPQFSSKDTTLKADLKASDFAKQFAKEFEINSQLPEASETNSQLPEEQEPKSGYGKRHIAAGLIGGVCAVVAAPGILGAVGFTSVGIAGSYAASMMSAAAIANGGGVAAGSAVAVLQSVGAVGLGTAGAAAVGSAGAAAGAGASGLAGVIQDYFKGKAPQTDTSTDDDDGEGGEHGGGDGE